jgi:oxepin-CoA hydrolase / 3-oxo-5,6-dehydrosuberyl-CoA semialdehyde dehydrogenase
MGPLASLEQREEVRRSLKALARAGVLVNDNPENVTPVDADSDRGAFLGPALLRCDEPRRPEPHEVEPFGPVATLMPFDGAADAIEMAALGQGSLVGSIVTADHDFARALVLGLAPWHGRLLVLDRDCAAESTGHGTPMPQLVHGGPGRAGGGEEEGGIRAVLNLMQRVAVQGSPDLLSGLSA